MVRATGGIGGDVRSRIFPWRETRHRRILSEKEPL